MIHHSILFLAPEGSVPQATTTSPPAVHPPARRPRRAWTRVRFVAGVVGNAAGFGMLLAASWFSVQLLAGLMGGQVP